MAEIKSYTDIFQSKKLAEILPLESADYHYIIQGEKSYFYPYSLSGDAVKDYDEEIKYIPCWSLVALLDVLPDYTLKNNRFYGKVALWCQGISVEYDNPVDACYEMILQLNGMELL